MHFVWILIYILLFSNKYIHVTLQRKAKICSSCVCRIVWFIPFYYSYSFRDWKLLHIPTLFFPPAYLRVLSVNVAFVPCFVEILAFAYKSLHWQLVLFYLFIYFITSSGCCLLFLLFYARFYIIHYYKLKIFHKSALPIFSNISMVVCMNASVFALLQVLVSWM